MLNNTKFIIKNLPSKYTHSERSDNLNACTEYLFNHDCSLYVENYFHKMLALERKRTERSKNRFLLMLIHIQNHRWDGDANKIKKKLAYVLSSTTREIDIKGWYKYNSVIGVIFTEMNGTDKNLIRDKIYNKLGDILDIEQAEKIEISSHVFPEESNKERPDTLPDLNLYPDLSKRDSSQRASLFLKSLKRMKDILGSILALIILSPVFLIIPILIKFSSEGPIFFRQERVGRFGKRFTFLKFRTMYANNDQNVHREYIKNLIGGEADRNNGNGNGRKKCAYKINNDSRVTPIGRFLRKSSLDEIPQFINVLRGEMSLVGPRPPIPYELENYDIWHLRRILETKPGITGIWQVHGRSSTTFDEMVRMDIRYVREWSLWLDIKILLKTPWVVLTGKGAY
ncbi:MAG: sugar transferase [Candidatus Scalindua sp.]